MPLFALALMAEAAAGPVYLDCYLDRPDGREPLALSLNEDKGTITITNPRATWSVPASFTADKVIWGDDPVSFTIDRTTLKLVRAADAGDVHQRYEGICKFAPKKKRAF